MTRDPLSPQWEDCKVCGGDHWTKDHRDTPESTRPVRVLGRTLEELQHVIAYHDLHHPHLTPPDRKP